MLKIKANIDLKELEKFAFKEYDDYYTRDFKNDNYTAIYKDSRKIIRVDYDDYKVLRQNEKKDRVQDLIKADLVEKVSD